MLLEECTLLIPRKTCQSTLFRLVLTFASLQAFLHHGNQPADIVRSLFNAGDDAIEL